MRNHCFKFALIASICWIPMSASSQTASAIFTHVQNEVSLMARGDGKSIPATINLSVSPMDVVMTGVKSMAEITLSNQTFVRVGSLSNFVFNKNLKDLTFKKGEAVFVFPKGKGGSTIATAGLTAAITGTTVYMKITRSELIYACLEGTCKIGPHAMGPGDKLVIRTGQTAYNTPIQKFKIEDIFLKNALFTSFPADIPSKTLIEKEIASQK